MRRRLVVCGWVLVAAMSIVGCEGADSDALTDADRAALKTAADSMAALANSGSIASWADFMTATVEQLPPNAEAMVGKDAVVAGLKAFPPVSGLRFMQDEVDGQNGLAFVKGRYEMSIMPPGAPPIADHGKYIEIWRKQADGRWLLDRDMYSSSVPLPMPESAPKPKP